MALPKPWNQDGDRIDSGQAQVFPVRRADDEHLYALKRLRNTDRAPRFEREIRVMHQLHQDGLAVPEVIGHGVDHKGRPYFVMPWFEQGALAAQIEAGTFAGDLERGMRFLIRLAELLAELHRRDRAHRDLKPENVLLADSKPYLTDFGLSLSSKEEDPETRLTAEREGVGSRLYIAPENEGGFNEEVDQRPADFYAFGKLAWAVLVGQPPPAREQQELPEKQLTAIHRNAILESLDGLFADMIKPDPRARLRDWEVVVQGLALTLRKLGDTGQDDPSAADLVAKARAAARQVRTSDTAIDSKRAEEERERRMHVRGELRQAITTGLHSRDQDLSDISNESAPLLRIQVGGPPEIMSKEGFLALGVESPPGLVLDNLTTPEIMASGVGVHGIDILDGTSDGDIDAFHVGLHSIVLGDRVWIARSVQASRRSIAATAVLTTQGSEYARWIGPLQMGLETTNAAAEELAEETIEVGIRLFHFCAEQLADGRKLSDNEVWGMLLWPPRPAYT